MEKKVMIRLCAKIVADTDLYETDKEVQNLIDWVCLSEQIKENNNTIRNLTGGACQVKCVSSFSHLFPQLRAV